MDEPRDSSLPLFSKKPKVQKKVSFDTKVHRVNFAKKSTSAHHGVVRRRRLEMKNRRMVLKTTKVDTTGYKFPTPEAENGNCARLIPVEEVLSCSRTNPARKTASAAALHSMKSNNLMHSSNMKKRKIEPEGSNCIGTVEATVEPPCKKSKVTNKNLESPVRDVQPLQPQDEVLSPDCGTQILEVEYALKLNETIKKITGNQNPTNVTKKKKKKKRSKDHVVRYPLINIREPMSTQSQSCSLDVKTVNITQSKSVQADSGFIVDKEVMDSYVDVKIKEALYDMKEVLQNVEEQFTKVVKEKAKMESVLKEKVQLIRALTTKDFKVRCADKSVATDSVEIGPKPTDTTNPKPLKKQRNRPRHVGTQTLEEDHACLQPMLATSLAPYLQLRPSSPVATDNESGEETENSEKVEWLFHKSHSSARCQAIRPQVRLLRALKKNIAQHRPFQYASMYKDILPDAVGWDSLGSELQNVFSTIFKLSHVLEMLPLEPVLIDSRETVVRSLTHLLSHLPIPNSVTQTVNMAEINQPRTVAMASYVFGWKVKEVIFLLRTAYRSSFADILPDYFKAELCRADRISYDCLIFALQGMRNMAISHSSLSSDSDFITSSSCAAPNWYGLGEEEFSDSSDSDLFNSDIEDPIPQKQVKKVKRASRRKSSSGETSPQVTSAVVSENEDGPSPAVSSVSSRKRAAKKVSASASQTPSKDHCVQTAVESNASQSSGGSSLQPPTTKRLQDSALGHLSMSQLVSMSHIVQSRIARLESNPSEACFIPRAVSRLLSQNSTAPAQSTNGSSFHINISSSGNVCGKVLCKPISSSPAISCSLSTLAAKDKATSGLVSAQSRVHVQPLSAVSRAEFAVHQQVPRNTLPGGATSAAGGRPPQQWKLDKSSGLPIWQPVNTTATTSSTTGGSAPGTKQHQSLPMTTGKGSTSISTAASNLTVGHSVSDLQKHKAAAKLRQWLQLPTSRMSVDIENPPRSVAVYISNPANQHGSSFMKPLAQAVCEVPKKSNTTTVTDLTAESMALNRSTNNNIDTGISLGPVKFVLPGGPAVVVSKDDCTTTTTIVKPQMGSTQKVQDLMSLQPLPPNLTKESACLSQSADTFSSLQPQLVSTLQGCGLSSLPSPSAHAVQVQRPCNQLPATFETQAWTDVQSHSAHNMQAPSRLQPQGVLVPMQVARAQVSSSNLQPQLAAFLQTEIWSSIQSQQAYKVQAQSQVVNTHGVQLSPLTTGVKSQLTQTNTLRAQDSGQPPMDSFDCGCLQPPDSYLQAQVQPLVRNNLHIEESGCLQYSGTPVGIYPLQATNGLHPQPGTHLASTITVQERIAQVHSYACSTSNGYSTGVRNSLQQPSIIVPSPTLNPRIHTMNSQATGICPEFLKKLECYRPIIIGGARKVNDVFIQWTFPGGIELSVSRYDIFYTTKPLENDDFHPQWKMVGCVVPLPLPMCVTLSDSNTQSSEQCTFSIQAIFPNGYSSSKSAPLTL